MGGIFAGLDSYGSDAAPAYNTVTSPDQQAAVAAGNDQSPTQQSPDETPFAKIMAAVMRGSAKLQGQEQMKQVLAKQQANADKRVITLKPNPDDPGNPRITLKDFTADVINGTEQSDLAKTYTTPTDRVEKKLSGNGDAPPPTPQPTPAPQVPEGTPLDHIVTTPSGTDSHPIEIAARAIDASTGQHTPRPWEIDPEKLKSEDGIRSLIVGDGWGDVDQAAHDTWTRLRHGKTTPEVVARNIANKRLRNIHEQSQQIEATLAPAERQALRVQAETDRQDRLTLAKQEEQRRVRSQTDAEVAAANKEKLDWLKTTDTAHLSPDQLETTARSSTQAEWKDSDINRLMVKHKADVRAAFDKFTDGSHKEDVFNLGTYNSWQEAKSSLEFAPEITPEMDKQGAIRWQAAHRYTVNKATDENNKQQAAAASLELKMYKIEHEGDVKPVALDDGFVSKVPAEQLIGVLGKVKNPDLVLQRKEALLQKEIQSSTERRDKANAEAKSILMTPEQKRRWGWETPLATQQLEAKQHTARIAAAQAELQQIQAARAARQPSTKAPDVPNKPVANGRYTPETEKGITAYGKVHGFGRAKSIAALKDAGIIQ